MSVPQTITRPERDARSFRPARWAFVLAGALLAPAALAACAPNPADEVPSAVVEDGGALSGTAGEAPAPQPVEPVDSAAEGGESAEDDAVAEGGDLGAAPPQAALAGPIALEGDIAFTGSKVTGSHTCVFQSWSGTLDPGAGTPETATLSFTVDPNTLYCDAESRNGFTERLEGHLRGEDFFHVEAFPEATFVSTSIEEGGEGGATHTVSGDLTIRGITQPIRFPATVTVEPGGVAATAEFVVDRQLWQLSFPGQPDDLIRDEVVLAIDLRAGF